MPKRDQASAVASVGRELASVPHFSVVVPAYNAESTLAETLDAVLAQTFSAWECVVVDDGSEDGTASVASGYCDSDPRFRLIRQENAGTAGAYNTGVENAAGNFITICSADDLLLPDHLAAMYEFIEENPAFDIYSCNGYYLRPDGRRDLVYTQPQWQARRQISFEEVVTECFYGVGATYNQELFHRVGGYRAGIYAEDYDFWVRALAQQAKHCYSPARTTVHRIAASQKSADGIRALDSAIQILEHVASSVDLTPAQDAAVVASLTEHR
ncbi:MAG: glycosyltransferase family 2 protein, partial [Actinomycetota bacterium]|nr:glycosyltransferase family 2 protein [Actinomycetota bacterium]